MQYLDFESDDARPRRKHSRARKGVAHLALLLSSTALAGPALADTVSTSPPPVAESIDLNGVDVTSGQYSALNPNVKIGNEETGIEVSRNILGSSYTDSLTSYIQVYGSGTAVTLVIDAGSVKFTGSGGTFTPVEQNGDTLTQDAGGYTFTRSDGTVYRYSGQSYQTSRFGTIFGLPLTSVTYPSGKKYTYYYGSATIPSGLPGAGETGLRLQSVKSNTGYEVHLLYAHPDVQNQGDERSWSDAIQVVTLNSLYDPCDPAANACANTSSYPHIASSTATQTQKLYEDSAGYQTRFQLDAAGHVIGVAPPASINYAYMSYNGFFNGKYAVDSITTPRGTTTYTYSTSGSIGTVTAKNGSDTRTYRVDLTNNHLLAVIDELGRETDYHYNSLQQLDQISYPKGNFDTFEYDLRGNLTRTVKHPKVGSTLPNIVTSAVYPSSCTNPVTCNKPSSTTDGNGATTDYTYDSVHGGVLTVTGPAPTPGAVRPQIRYSYVQLDANGQPSSAGVFVVSKTSSCATQASCSGTADEAVTNFTYGPNLLATSITSAAGDGSVSSTRTFAYDKVGNITAADGPLSGTADTTYFKYDADRQVTATIKPDPDGTGPLKYRATRTTLSAQNLPARVEVGTVSDWSDASVAGMSVLEATDTTYDYYRRKTSETVSAGGTTYSVTQYSYDALSRLNCTAVRMNPGNFGSLPSDACTAGAAGSFGPDRIVQNGYDAAGQLKTVTTGVGTSTPRATAFTYNLNGNLQTVTDPKGNVTNYVYDDLVRLYQVHYPDPATGAWSATDYEQFGYDGNGNVTSRRIRNNTTITYTYDALNRLTKKVPSSGSSNPTVTYSYDLLGRITAGVSQTVAHTVTTNFGYDALGRKLTDTSLLDGMSAGTKSMRYDAAGRRIRLTWSDGFYVTYDYDNADEMTAIRENGGSILESFAYDDLGRRASRTAANGTSASYGYDTASRLTGLSLNGGANPTTITLGGYNPAGQIGSRTVTNDVYAWTAGVNGSHSYGSNGLNQIASIDGVTQSYDPKGNKTGQAGTAFTYGIENTMTTGGSATFLYDAFNRLVNSTVGGRFDYDGDRLVSEASTSGQLTRRYVFGPAIDEPLVWFEGAGASIKRYLDADERGSVIRATDGAGTVVATNTYDEYGLPGSVNSGRFQYTGQSWLPEVSLYNYKARMYSPQIGRFMQPDPIGQQGGINLYNYVLSDPINSIDQTGLDGDIVVNGQAYYEDYSVGFTSSGNWTTPSVGNDNEAASRARAKVSDITVIGRRKPAPVAEEPPLVDPNLIFIGADWLTDLPRDVQALEKMREDELKKPPAQRDTQLLGKIKKQLKNAGEANKNKVRGLGRFRVWPFIIVPSLELQNFLSMCRLDPNSSPRCHVA
jgi:RHS repeat-associated protein